MTKAHFKKYFPRYVALSWFLLLLLLPFVIALSSTIVGAYLRLTFYFILGLGIGAYSVWVLFAPTEKYFKREAVIKGLSKKQIIFSYIFRAISVPLLMLSLYFFLPIAIGSFDLFILREPFEVIDDTVVYVQSQHNGVISNQSCVFITCSFKVSGEPGRSLDSI